MELLLALGAFVLVDVLAIRYSFDSRPSADHDAWRAIRSK